jgi:hypothetical protein
MFALTLNGVDHINRLDNYNGDEMEFRSTELVVQCCGSVAGCSLQVAGEQKEMLIGQTMAAATSWASAADDDDDDASCDNGNMIHFVMPINYSRSSALDRYQSGIGAVEAFFPCSAESRVDFLLHSRSCDTSTDKTDNFLLAPIQLDFSCAKINFMLIFISTRCFDF